MQSHSTRFIALPEVIQRTSLRKSSIYRLIKAGELRPVKLGRKTVFSETELNAWIESRLNSRGVNHA